MLYKIPWFHTSLSNEGVVLLELIAMNIIGKSLLVMVFLWSFYCSKIRSIETHHKKINSHFFRWNILLYMFKVFDYFRSDFDIILSHHIFLNVSSYEQIVRTLNIFHKTIKSSPINRWIDKIDFLTDTV